MTENNPVYVLEKTVEDAAVDYAEKEFGCIVRKLTYPGRRGAPDRMFVFPNAVVMFLEFKRPKGGVRHPAQIREINRFKGAGVRAAFVSTLKQAKILIRLAGSSRADS